MKKFVRVSVIGILFLLAAGRMYAQSNVTINPDKFQDSTTFVNLKYITSSFSNKYDLSLTFTGGGKYDNVQVNWGDGVLSGKSTIGTTIKKTYDKEGCFPIEMYFFPGTVGGEADTLHAWALNTDLSLSFVLEPVGEDKSEGCLSYGADTLLLRFVQNPNPPLTRYTVNIESGAPMIRTEGTEGMFEIVSPEDINLESSWVHACWANKEPGRRDSIWLIFTEATGVSGAEISVTMTCDYFDEKEKPDNLEKKSHQIETIYLFDKPDLKQIFRQDHSVPFPDTLDALQNFNVCAPGKPNEFGFYGDWFAKYQTFVLSKPSPKREDRSIFKVKCYYTEDSVWSDNVTPSGVTWHDVTGKSEYFNDTTLTFNQAGFYMVRWEIYNQCNEEKDTLWTSLVRKKDSEEYYDDKFRYIQVYENQEASLDYIGDSVFCLNMQDSVILVDRNRRKYYDVPPDYSLKIVKIVDDIRVTVEERDVELVETKIYKNGNILNFGTDAGNFAKVKSMGCDSTTITLHFPQPGNYEVTWERKGKYCEEGRTKMFKFHVGDVPAIQKDTLRQHCFRVGKLDIKGGELYKCGSYTFNVPDLSNAFDSRNRDIDSVRYKFVKGARDSVLVYKKEFSESSFLFDSTGANYILVNIYNGCGISNTDSVGFYTPAMPNVTIWRDSVEIAGTDTLCLNAEYKYYLHGVLPANAQDSVFFGGNANVDINGTSIVGGSIKFSKLRKRNENYGVIKYTAKGEFIERYKILNKDFPACSADFNEKVVVVEAPDSMIYKNDKEILYCASLDTLDTRVLFKKDVPVFNRATWKWTGQTGKDGKLPKLLFRESKNDTLYVNTIQSENCYFRDTLVFKPQPVPQANLNPIEEVCVPDTLNSKDFQDFVKNGNLQLSTMKWKVYKNAYYGDTNKDTLLYDPEATPPGKIILNEQSADSIGLIYYMRNTFSPIYKDFSDNYCWRLDTLPVKVHKPRLKILKKDTLDKDKGVYDFTEIQTKYVDTKDLNEAAWTWEVGWNDSDGSFKNDPFRYELGTDDGKLDSLLFILTAHTYCDDPISDTLIVYFPRIVINAHRDTICNNTTDYALWGVGKTTGLFVNTETLEWRIIKDASNGRLSAETGSGVKYILGGDAIARTDTVKIEVKGTSTADIGVKTDTVLLWINPAPFYIQLQTGDTLIADIDQEIRIDKIKALKYQNVSGLKVQGTSEGAKIESDSLIKSTLDRGAATENRRFTADITLKALPGCEDVLIEKLPMMDLVYPYSRPKSNPLDLCAEEEYGVDSLFIFRNDEKDRFTKAYWSNNGTGMWKKSGDDTVAYVAGEEGGINVDKITLKLVKQYTAYDSTMQLLSPANATRSFSVNVHTQPTIGFNPDNKDTLCSSSTTIELKRGIQGMNAKILVTPDFYKDSLRFNGEKLSEDIYHFRKNEGETDTVYVTVGQGRCVQWSAYKEELYLYKRESMPKKLQNVSVCETGSVEITYPEGVLKQGYYWKWDTVNGRLDTIGKGLSPRYYPKTTAEGMVELHVNPWPNCEGEDEYDFCRITVYKRADVLLPEEQVICKEVGNTLPIPIVINQSGSAVAEVQSIEWRKGYSKNSVATVIANASSLPMSEFRYNLTAEDIEHDTMYIVAKTMFNTPCGNESTNDTVVIVLSGQPVITRLQTPEVCQGDTLKLLKASGSNGWLKIENAVSVDWQKGAKGNVLDSLFLTGENSGSTQITAIAQGFPGCAEEIKEIPIEIKEAPIPQFEIISTSCQREQTELKSTVAASQCEWAIEGALYNTETVTHKFDGVGNIDVLLKQTYTYINSALTCAREHKEPVVIHPEAHARFEVIADFEHNGIKQIPTNEPLNVRNTSQPVEGTTAQWKVDRYITFCDHWELDCNSYTFSDTGRIAIKLNVTTQYGCTNDTTVYVKVVARPEPDFDVKVDSCGNTAEFTLGGSLNGATVWWDWGKGSGFEQDTRSDLNEPQIEMYSVGYQDTTYHVVLKLINAAAPEGVTKEMDIHFVSRLDASFEILPELTGCHEIYRKIRVDIKGRNDAGYVVWGDKWYNPDPKNVDSIPFKGHVSLLSHRFENLGGGPVKDTIRLHVENTCFDKADTNYLTVLSASVGAEIGLVNGSSLCFESDVLKVKNSSVGFEEETVQWEWKFGSENSTWSQSNRDTATYRYLTPGTYTVTLHIWDRCNSDTNSQEIIVRGNDSLWFEVLSPPYCSDQTLTMKFVQKGEAEFGDLRWTIYEAGTGRSLRAVADSMQLTYKFTKTGNYNVLLTAKAEGCYDRHEIPLHINETPEAMISLINGSSKKGCEVHTVEFQAADGSGLKKMPHILWDFRNGVKSSQLKEKVVFENEGVYNVSLTLESDSGCISTAQQEIIVEHTPRISFITDDSLFCQEKNGAFDVHIENTSEDLDRCRFEWFKKVGAGSEESIIVAPQLALLHFENVNGIIGLRLFATDLMTGCQQNFTKEIVASDAVEAHIFKEAEYVCLDNPVYFASWTENVDKVLWNMGDGGMSADTAFEYTYDRVGDKMITLRVENRDGCYDFDTLHITVYPLPVADFEWKKNSGIIEGYPDTLDLPEVDNGGVEFTNYSIVTPGNWGTELYYSWNFGDSTTVNTAKNPTHRYENNGLYEVWLKATTAYGCVDSVGRTVSIDAVKGLYIPTAFAPAMPDEELGEGNSYMGSARFQPKGIGLYSYQIQVYEPWSGTCVWSSTALKNGQPAEYWDGKFNGADAPAGNYIWKINAIFIDGSVWVTEKGLKEGMVILIR